MKIKKLIYLTLLYLLIPQSTLFAQQLNLDSCITALKTSKNDTNKVILLNIIAWDISYSSLAQGAYYSEQSINLIEDLGYERLYANTYHIAGSIYTDMKLEAKALNYELAALKYAQKYNQIKLIPKIYNGLGNLYNVKMEYRKALSYYYLSVGGHIKNNAKSELYKPYNNLAFIYSKLGKTDSAIYCIELCISRNIKENNKEALINNYMILAEIYYDSNNPSKSLLYAKIAVEMARSIEWKVFFVPIITFVK